MLYLGTYVGEKRKGRGGGSTEAESTLLIVLHALVHVNKRDGEEGGENTGL